MINAFKKFLQENDNSRTIDRNLLTLTNFRRLATFLNSFPGRKNVIWFSEGFPLVISGTFDPHLQTGQTEADRTLDTPSFDPRMKEEAAKTLNLLATARVALYPVDARGTAPLQIDTAETQMPATQHDEPSMLNSQNSSRTNEALQRDVNQGSMKIVAEETGGKAFVNSNGLDGIIRNVADSSNNFYTLSYSPGDTKMDGAYRRIDVKVQGGNYRLSYRRGYVALADSLPGSGMTQRETAIQDLAQKNPGAVDPLLPFMDLGMPQSQQILYEAKIQPAPAGDVKPGDPKDAKTRYTVDFAIDAKDLRLPAGPDGVRKGRLNISLIAYDRYGNVIGRKDHVVQLDVKPDVWAIYQNAGVQLRAEIVVPDGNYWLRTGVYDQQSRKVGTMEVALAGVQAAAHNSGTSGN
jgi:hypothetical protein